MGWGRGEGSFKGILSLGGVVLVDVKVEEYLLSLGRVVLVHVTSVTFVRERHGASRGETTKAE